MIKWQVRDGKLLVGGNVIPLTSTRPLSEMRPVLQTPEATGPDPLYRVYRRVPNPEAPAGNHSDITILEPGVIGREYTKTHGHYHLGDGEEIYQLLSGSGSLLLQKPGFNFDSVEAVRLVSLHPTQPVIIPSGWGHTLINTGDERLVALNTEPGLESFYAAYEKKHGAAYYVTKGGNGPELEPNPAYSDLPKIQTF